MGKLPSDAATPGVDRRSHATDVILVCSTGGHLLQLLGFAPAWEGRTRLWVTHANSDAKSLLRGESVVYAHSPTTRNVPNLLRNLLLAWRVVRRERPRALVTTGAGVAVPFAWIAWLHGVPVAYVESLTRVDGLSMSARLIAPVAARLYVQWPELASSHARAEYHGNLLAVE